MNGKQRKTERKKHNTLLLKIQLTKEFPTRDQHLQVHIGSRTPENEVIIWEISAGKHFTPPANAKFILLKKFSYITNHTVQLFAPFIPPMMKKAAKTHQPLSISERHGCEIHGQMTISKGVCHSNLSNDSHLTKIQDIIPITITSPWFQLSKTITDKN